MDLQTRIHGLNQMILHGQIVEAIDKYYADDVVMQENEQTPTVGKEENRTREQEWLDQVTEFREVEVKSVAVDPSRGITMVEWFFDYTHQVWGDRTYHQISVQRWEDGKIAHERFYYGS